MTLHKNRTQICTVSYGDNGLGHMCGHSVGQGAPAVPPPAARAAAPAAPVAGFQRAATGSGATK